jgi:2-iminobutanoate/2-iminopropanoate deaminase
MNAPQTDDAGISHQVGRYSDAVRAPANYDQIVVSGTPGLDEDGNIPADFADEARQAWRNVASILEKAGASISDIVSIRQYLTREEDIKTYVAVQREVLTHERAAMPGPHGNGVARDPRRDRSRSARPIRPLTCSDV